MLGAEYQWLFSLASARGAARMRLARQGLLTLVLGFVFLAGTLTSPTPVLARIAAASAPAALKVDANSAAAADWSEPLVFFWMFVPHLIPHDN